MTAAIQAWPAITSITPTTGPVTGGSFIRLRGQNFSADTKVYFGSLQFKYMIAATFVVLIDSRELYVSVPPYFLGSADLLLVNGSSAYAFAPAAYTYVNFPPAPVDPQPRAASGDALGLLTAGTNHFALYPSQSHSSMTLHFQLGFSRTAFMGAQGIAGRFDGQAGDTVGFYDGRAKTFHLHLANATADEAHLQFGFDGPLFLSRAIAGDFNGDGTDTVGLYNVATGEFRMKNANTQDAPISAFSFMPEAAPHGQPVVGDWNGDGTDTIGVFDAHRGVVHLRNHNSAGPPDTSFAYGDFNSSAVAGDWNNDGRDTIAMFDRLTNQLKVREDLSEGPPHRVIQFPEFGTVALQPLAGRWRAPAPGTIDVSTGYDWPTSTPEAQRMDRAKLDEATILAASLPGTRSMVIIRNGYLVREMYLHGARPSLPANIKSVSKSILSALYGIAWRDGLLDLAAPIRPYLPASYFPAGTDPRKLDIKFAHVLTMSAGLKFNESDPSTMFSWIWSTDALAKWVIDQPMVSTPGSVFNYSTGLTHVAARILADAAKQDLAAYADAKLFKPLGIRVNRWDHDPEGYKIGGAEMFMTPRDMARFGHLYLHGGFLGHQIVPKEWVKASTVGYLPTYVPERAYGAWWWVQTLGGYSTYFALGYGGQIILNVPQLNLTVVFTSKSDVPIETDAAQDAMLIAIIEKYIIAGTRP